MNIISEIFHFVPLLFLLFPLVGGLTLVFLNRKSESLISRFSFGICFLHLLTTVLFSAIWLMNHHPELNYSFLSLWPQSSFEYELRMHFDKISFVFLFLGSLIAFLVTSYSRYYLHREEGYKRFFSTLLFFFMGYNLVVLAGNPETLLPGWEMLAVSSFLLISFYRERNLPVRNGLKVYSLFRIGDIALLLSIWIVHYLWHGKWSFASSSAENFNIRNTEISVFWPLTALSLLIVLAAAIKSAQIPFTVWLPRAMEGPTPSSAIFYGSLSVHLGAFLLLRSHALWIQSPIAVYAVIFLGLSTTLISSLIAATRSSIKGQIAYSSATQIGLIFVEIGLGWDIIALLHISANAFLRTYQLLISPTVVSYLIQQQIYNKVQGVSKMYSFLPEKMRHGLYLLSLKEWNFISFLRKIYWTPLKWVGNKLHIIPLKITALLSVVLFLLLSIVYFLKISLPSGFLSVFVPYFAATASLVCMLKSFTMRGKPIFAVSMVAAGHFWMALSFLFISAEQMEVTVFYLSGIVLSYITCLACLWKLQLDIPDHNIRQFSGHFRTHPRMAFVFFIASLGLAVFPITFSFVGEDLLFSRLPFEIWPIAIIFSLVILLAGFSQLRIYCRIFLGPKR